MNLFNTLLFSAYVCVVVYANTEEGGESKPQWSMSHKHKRSASQKAENVALRHWKSMATDNKKKMMHSMKKYKEGFEKEDSDKMKEALKELEEIGKRATKEGDTSMSKLIPAVIDQLKSQKLKPHEEEEVVDEVNLDPTVDDYLKSHKIKKHEEEETVEEPTAEVEAVDEVKMGAKEKKRKRRIARAAKARDDSEKKVEDFMAAFPTVDPIPGRN